MKHPRAALLALALTACAAPQSPAPPPRAPALSHTARGRAPTDFLPRGRLGALDQAALARAAEAFQSGRPPEEVLREVWREPRGAIRTRVRIAIAAGGWLQRARRLKEAGDIFALAARLAGQCRGEAARSLELEAEALAGRALFEAGELAGAWRHLRRADALLQARGEPFQGVDAFRLGVLAALNGQREMAAGYFARVPGADHRAAARALGR